MKRLDRITVRDLWFWLKGQWEPTLAWLADHRRQLWMAALVLALTCGAAGFWMPTQAQKWACLEQVRTGEAPGTAWRWHPLVLRRAAADRDDLLRRSRAALALGRPLAEANAAALELAWANAVRPQDPEIAAMLVWALYYGGAPRDRTPSLANGLRDLADRRGVRGPADAPLLCALSACGVLDVAQSIRLFDRMLVKDPAQGGLKSAKDFGSEACLAGLRQQQAFAQFRYAPNDLAWHMADFLSATVPAEQERCRLGQLAFAQAWTQGVSPAAEALSKAAGGDPWLADVSGRLALAPAANGLEMDGVDAALRQVLGRLPAAPELRRAVEMELDTRHQENQIHWEGWVCVDKTGAQLPRKDFQARLRRWGQEARPLPTAAVIEPPVGEDGHLEPLGSALASMANYQAAELPQPMWSHLSAEDTLFALGALRPGTVWDDLQGVHLQQRTFAAARIQGRLVHARGRWRLSLRRVQAGQAGPWASRSFGTDLMKAPGWMAEQSLRLSGLRPSAADRQVLARPIFRDAGDLREFAAWKTGDFRFGNQQWLRRLYARRPDPFLLFCGMVWTEDGRQREKLEAEAVAKEPWRWQEREWVDYQDFYNGREVAAVSDAMRMLDQDPGCVSALENADKILHYLGLEGERLQLADTALSVTARAPAVLLYAAQVEQDWAWFWRKEGWASSVTPFAWNCVDVGLGRARTLALEARDKDLDHGLIYARLIGYCTALRGDDAEKEDYLRASNRIDPGFRDTYENRLRDLEPEWHGDREKLLSFARGYRDQVWDLPVQAHNALADEDDGHGPPYWQRKENWNEVNEAFVAHLTAVPDDIDAAGRYGWWASMAHHWEDAYKTMQLLWSLPAAQPHRARLTINFLDGLAEGWGFDEGRTHPGPGARALGNVDVYLPAFYEHHVDLWDLRCKELRFLCEAYPENLWPATNLARWSYAMKRRDLCAWALGRLHGRFDPTQWTSENRDKAKKFVEEGLGGGTKI